MSEYVQFGEGCVKSCGPSDWAMTGMAFLLLVKSISVCRDHGRIARSLGESGVLLYKDNGRVPYILWFGGVLLCHDNGRVPYTLWVGGVPNLCSNGRVPILMSLGGVPVWGVLHGGVPRLLHGRVP